MNPRAAQGNGQTKGIPMSAIEKQVINAIRKVMPREGITRDSTWEELNADSLEVVEVMLEVEKETGVTIPDGDAATMRTVGDVIDYVERAKKSVNV
jgi:acyl carrier protein